jgi:hypothetical protein
MAATYRELEHLAIINSCIVLVIAIMGHVETSGIFRISHLASARIPGRLG